MKALLTVSILALNLSMAKSASAADEPNGFYGLKTLGAANVMACEDIGQPGGYTRKLAEDQALGAAQRDCFTRENGSNAQPIAVRVLVEYRGSCWTDTKSSVAVELTYTCKKPVTAQ